jgi:acetyl esterase/lipase
LYAALARRVSACALAVLGAACALPGLVLPRAHAPLRPAAPELRRAPVYLYPAYADVPDPARPPRAYVFFFGNDVGFWRAHERLAELLRAQGYAVAGVDVRRLLRHLPRGPARDSVFLRRVDLLLARARPALGADSAPLVVAGHSIGGELAVWAAARLPEPALVGVVSMSPGARGHLGVGLGDMLGREPHGADSFAVDSEVARLVPRVRVALVRGSKDDFRRADPAIVAAGARRFVAEGQGHSLLDLRAAGPVVLAAFAFALGDTAHGEAAPPTAPDRAPRSK